MSRTGATRTMGALLSCAIRVTRQSMHHFGVRTGAHD